MAQQAPQPAPGKPMPPSQLPPISKPSPVKLIINGLKRDLKSLNMKKINDWLNSLPKNFPNYPKNVKIALILVLAGIVLFIVQIFLWVLL